jgi:hypothetical protein
MIFAGVDPGKSGALALLDADGHVLALFPTPLVQGVRRPDYDLGAIAETLAHWRRDGVFVTVEKSQPMPPKMPGGTIANFNRGVSTGWTWMLAALRIPHHVVPAVTWQRRMHEGTNGSDPKARSIIAAGRLFPDVSLLRTPRCRRAHDGFADALLIAEYGRRLDARKISLDTSPRP